jgi:DNA-binding HxlR family transcriptional regulator
MLKPNVFSQSCAARIAHSHIANKWSMLVIDVLAEKTMRNAELLRAIEGLSQRILTKTLRELETLALVERTDFKTVPPHVEYRLTPLGKELRKEVCRLDRWIEQNLHLLR